VLAYFALKLNNAEDVKNYCIESNAQDLGKFDDVVIDIWTKNDEHIRLCMQVKHLERTSRSICVSSLKNSNRYDVNKYYKAYQTIEDKHKIHQFILYTNAVNGFKVTTGNTKKNEITSDQFNVIEDSDHKNDITKIFDSNSNEGNVYRFKANKGDTDYKYFLSRLRYFVCQKNLIDLEKDITNTLEAKAIDFISFFRNLHQGRFENKKIDKATVNVHLINIFLWSYIITDRYFTVGPNKKLKLFQKVIQVFDVTLVNDSCKDFTKNLTEEGILKKVNIKTNAADDESIMDKAKGLKIIMKSAKELNNEVKLKVLRFTSEEPIIVNFNQISNVLIYKIMELHRSKMKFILVGKGIQSDRLPTTFRIFENVNDLLNNDKLLYSDVIQTIYISLQGRKEMTLKELIDSSEEIKKHFGAKEILQMIKEKIVIGQATQSLPSFYVNREVSFKVETIYKILDDIFFKEHLAVVKFDSKMTNEICKRNIKVVDIHHYLESPQISNEPTIISTNEECSEKLLQDVSEKSDNKSVVYLKISENNGFLIISVEENQIHCLTRQVNILCADAGTGKTTLLKKLSNECDSRFWTIYLDLKTHKEFFKTKHDANELLNHLIEGKENGLSKQIRDVFQSEKKVYLFFDGLDEVEKSSVDNVLDSVKKLSSEGSHVWVSSRKHLKMKLEDCFQIVAMDMEELEEAQQKLYIKKSLQERQYEDEQIKNVISKIFTRSDIDNTFQVLGNVLQLSVITQHIIVNKEHMTEHTFGLTKMYDLFFRGRFKHNQGKEDSKNPNPFEKDVAEVFEIWELVAVHSVFGEEVLKLLDVDYRRVPRYLKRLETNTDPLGVVTQVNDEGKAVFEYFTYGEYFAARFFAYNRNFARRIEDKLFSDGHKNLMMILNVILAEESPLHLAVINRDMAQIKKYIEVKNFHDAAYRNPLHLATYIEPRCVDWKSCLIKVSEEYREYLKNIEILKEMLKFKYIDQDELFHYSALQYAVKNKSFISVELILKTFEDSEKDLLKITEKNYYMNNDNLIPFCLTHGCSKLLSFIIANNQKSADYFEENASIIIEHTIKNCYFEEKKMLRFVIDTLINKWEFNLNSRNKQGETVLHLAVKYGKTYAVQMLVEKGAFVNALENYNYNKTPLHWAAQTGNYEIAALLIKNEADVNVREEKASLTPLHYAAQSGNFEIVNLLIEKRASVDVSTKNDLAPLHYAAQTGNYEIVALLIKNEASVNVLTKSRLTPLHYAAQSRNYKIVALLIKKEASVNVRTKSRLTPLHYAAQSGNYEIVALLIKKEASVNVRTKSRLTPLHYAAQSGNYETVALLIKKEASVNVRTKSSLTPLHYAAQNGNIEIVKLLIEKRAAVNVHTKSRLTPLHYAAQSQNSKRVALLIKQRTSVNALAGDDLTFLHYAAQSGNSKIVALLIEKGTSVNTLADDDLTFLHYAAQNKDSEIVALLIKKEASVNALGDDDLTPLHYAVQSGNSEIVALLIKNQADVNVRTKARLTPLHYAAQSGNSEIVSLLIEKRAHFNVRTKARLTPLHYAVQSGNSQIVALLIKKEPDVNVRTKARLTPLHYAVQSGNSQMVTFLIGKGASVHALAISAISENLKTV
jgi:ankyrin repeat protein